MADAGMLLTTMLGDAGGMPFSRVRCWTAACDGDRAAVLASLGFREAARLRGEIEHPGAAPADLVAYERT